MYFTMTPALSTTVKTEKGVPRQRFSKVRSISLTTMMYFIQICVFDLQVIDKISTSSGSAAVAGTRPPLVNLTYPPSQMPR